MRHSSKPALIGPSDELRILAGLAAQPFLASALAFVSFPLLLVDRGLGSVGGGFTPDPARAALGVAFDCGVIALLVTVICVLPTVLYLITHQPRVSLTGSLLFGVGFGNLPFAIGTILGGTYGVAGLVRGAVFASILGLGCATAFWMIALRVRRRARA